MGNICEARNLCPAYAYVKTKDDHPPPSPIVSTGWFGPAGRNAGQGVGSA